MTTKLVKVKIKDLIPNPDNLRSEYINIVALAQSIRTMGLIQPITGKLTKDKKLHIAAGHRRRAALMYLVDNGEMSEDDEIDVLGDTAAVDELKVTSTMLIENMQRSDLAPMDEADGVMRLVAEHGMKIAEIKDHLGVSLQWVKDRVALSSIEGTTVAEELVNGRLTIQHAVQYAGLTTDRQDKLCKKDKVPSRFDIESEDSRQRSQEKTLKLMRKLQKAGLLAITEHEAKRIAGTPYEDLVESADDMSIKSLLGSASTFADNQWNPGPGTWLDKTVIARHHHDATEAIDKYIETHGKGIVIVAVNTNGFYEWQQWSSVTVDEDGSTHGDAITDLDKMEDFVEAKNSAILEQYNSDVLAVKQKYLEDTKPADLLRGVARRVIDNELGWGSHEEMFLYFKLDHADDREERKATLESFAAQNQSNLAAVAMYLVLARRGGAESVGLELPAGPEYAAVEYDDYDDQGAYIHPSETEEVAA